VSHPLATHEDDFMTERRTWKVGLSVLLGLQVLVATALGLMAIADFPTLLGNFGLEHQPDMGILQHIMAYNLALSASVCVWCLVWIRGGNAAGLQLGATLGALMLVVSLLVFVRFDRVDILLFDGIRALLKVVFGVLAFREHQKHHARA
jgi:hypothetical protein